MSVFIDLYLCDVLSQELKAGLLNGQLLLDFLCQSGPPVLGVDIRALRSERTMFAEKLGALRLQWLLLQRELESQVCPSDINNQWKHHTCRNWNQTKNLYPVVTY